MEQMEMIPGTLAPVTDHPAVPWLYDMPRAPLKGLRTDMAKPKEVQRYHPYLYLKEGRALAKIWLRDVLLVRSDLNYVELLTCDNRRHVVRATLASLMGLLPPRFFQQVSRSTVINLVHLRAIEGNDLSVGAEQVRLSRTLRPGLLERLKILGCR